MRCLCFERVKLVGKRASSLSRNARCPCRQTGTQTCGAKHTPRRDQAQAGRTSKATSFASCAISIVLHRVPVFAVRRRRQLTSGCSRLGAAASLVQERGGGGPCPATSRGERAAAAQPKGSTAEVCRWCPGSNQHDGACTACRTSEWWQARAARWTGSLFSGSSSSSGGCGRDGSGATHACRGLRGATASPRRCSAQ